MLEIFGLETGAESVYRAMLDAPGVPMADVVKKVGLSGAQGRAAVADLWEQRLIRATDDEDVPLALHPRTALPALVARRRAQLHQQQAQLDVAQASVDAAVLDTVGARRDWWSGGVERLLGRDDVLERLATLCASGGRDLRTFHSGAAQPSWDESRSLDHAWLARGLPIRSVFYEALRQHSASMAYFYELAELGGQARTVPRVPFTMLIVDGETALVPLDAANMDVGALVVTEPSVLLALTSLFDSYWSAGRDLFSKDEDSRRNLTPLAVSTLGLLANGCKDDQVARQLGVSVRTVRRQIADLLSVLDARSRFQAGVIAARLDLV